MSDSETPLTTLRRIDAPNDPKIRAARLVLHSSGRMAEVCQLTNGVTTIRPVPPENLEKVLAILDQFEGRNQPPRTG
jgi:hypothetical protein